MDEDTGGTNENGPGCTAVLGALCLLGVMLIVLVALAGGAQ